MTSPIRAPFFEIGPKNLLRRREVEALATAAGQAGAEHDVCVLLTVPTAFVAPVHDLGTGVRVMAQGMDLDLPGPSMHRVTAEALVDAGASGVMLNHDADPLERGELESALARARQVGLDTVVCAATEADAVRSARLRPTVVLLEPPELIGGAGVGARPWIAPATAAVHATAPDVLAMHAGGVADPRVAHDIVAAGADGTGSTSGVLNADDPLAAARAFIAATRAGWEARS